MSLSSLHPSPPSGYRLRATALCDAEAVTALKIAVETAWHGESDVTLEVVREEWALPRLVLERDSWVLEDAADGLVGYGFCWVEAPPAEIVAEQLVHPAHRGRGLSALLLDLCETRAAAVVRAAGPAVDGVLGVWVPEGDAPRRALNERRGYRHIRTFLRLDRDLAAPVERPPLPAGVKIRTFRRHQDEGAVHAAGQEAFRDHFRPAAMDLGEWLAFRFVRGDLDLGLWFVAWDGDEVAGAMLAFETPVGGYLDELFVRRPWRGRGLGRALLLEACAELRRRGRPVAYLGVDSENPTGAMHLYGSAGFTQSRAATLVYEKTVTAPPEDRPEGDLQ
jgi:mycothiol synthase